MLKIKINRDEFDKINSLLPDICPEASFSLQTQDDNLVKFGFCNSAPCVVGFEMTAQAFCEMLDALNDIEIDAFKFIDKETTEDEECDFYEYFTTKY